MADKSKHLLGSGSLSTRADGGVPNRFVTVRAMAIACALMPALALWVMQGEVIWWTVSSSSVSLFSHVTFVIFLVALINLAVEKIAPRSALAPGEILTIYVMLAVQGTMASHDLLEIIIPQLAYPIYAANPQNRWEEHILQHLPSWAILSDFDAARKMAVGNSKFYELSVMKAWAKPLAFWSVFLLTMYAALFCLNAFFRQAWTEKERLSFPVIQIPLLIAMHIRALLSNRLFWIAFCIAGGIDILNGFNYLYPNLPRIPIVKVFWFRDYFVDRPWNAIAWTHISLYPFAIGLAFFLPVDLAFSCWFFFLLFKLQLIATSAVGVRELPGFPFTNEQAAGGYLALGLLAVWLARRHLAGVWRTIRGRPGGLDESREPMRYRTALIGLVVSWGLLVTYGVALGASFFIMVIFFLLFALYSLAIARMRAELGPPAHDLHAAGPEILMTNAMGTTNTDPGTLGTFSLFFWFNRAYRAHFSAHSMEGLKIAQIARITAKSMSIAIAVAVVVGLASTFWAYIHSLYVHGYAGHPVGQAFAGEAWWRMDGWIAFPKPPRIAATIATGLGLVFTLFLGVMRTHVAWWAWHPVGYATCSSWSMEQLWFCIFIAWVIKALITRYGGARAYQKAIPFFVGLVLGEFVINSVWTIYGAISETVVYKFWG